MLFLQMLGSFAEFERAVINERTRNGRIARLNENKWVGGKPAFGYKVNKHGKFDEFLDDFDKSIGINKIKCIHVNDSMNPIGSHKDRHANLGYGTIGFDNLINVIYNKRLDNIPKILETPWININEKDAYAPYKYEIEMIKDKKFNDYINSK